MGYMIKSLADQFPFLFFLLLSPPHDSSSKEAGDRDDGKEVSEEQ